MAAVSFTLPSMIRGFHVYKATWTPQDGESLPCARELTNIHDPYAISVVKNGSVVGHVPRHISAMCSLYIRRGGSIHSIVTGDKRYSRDLPQGGLEIPCTLVFTGETTLTHKLEKLLKDESDSASAVQRPTRGDAAVTEDQGNPAKKQKVDNTSYFDTTWIQFDKLVLCVKDKLIISNGDRLTDLHMSAFHLLLKIQFPLVYCGLSSTLQVLRDAPNKWVNNYLQVLHCRGDHWVTVSTIGCIDGEAAVYDSLYTSVDVATWEVLSKALNCNNITISVAEVGKQNGGSDCGLFAIAFATHLAFGKDPKHLESIQFNQMQMRDHLLVCFQDKLMKEFPISI